MIVSVCLVKGFQAEVQGKLSGFTSHIEMLDEQSLFNPDLYPITVTPSDLQEIRQTASAKHVQRVSMKMGVIKTQGDFAGVAFKGVAPEYDCTFLRSHLVAGAVPDWRKPEADSVQNKIVISQTLADLLHLRVGDTVYSYFFTSTIKQRRLTVAGIYQTHIQQFDNQIVWTDARTISRLQSWADNQCSLVEVQLPDKSLMPAATAALSKRYVGRTLGVGQGRTDSASVSILPLTLNPRTRSMLSWLDLLDLNVLVILLITIGVAGFGMMSGLLILILERTSAIGTLKALGASNRKVRHIFLWLSAHILWRGLLWGNVVGCALVLLQEKCKFIRLDPTTYYVDAVPVSFEWTWILILNVATLVLTLSALVLPSFFVSVIQPAKTIRFD